MASNKCTNAAAGTSGTARKRSERFLALSGSFGYLRALPGTSGRSPEAPESARKRPKAPKAPESARKRSERFWAVPEMPVAA
eukprot:5677941-Alexandrium_andersonii.AAC.1